jgi:hypothetical protein
VFVLTWSWRYRWRHIIGKTLQDHQMMSFPFFISSPPSGSCYFQWFLTLCDFETFFYIRRSLVESWTKTTTSKFILLIFTHIVFSHYFNCHVHRVGPDIEAQSMLYSDIYNPEFDYRLEFREPVFPATSLLMLKVRTDKLLMYVILWSVSWFVITRNNGHRPSGIY